MNVSKRKKLKMAATGGQKCWWTGEQKRCAHIDFLEQSYREDRVLTSSGLLILKRVEYEQLYLKNKARDIGDG